MYLDFLISYTWHFFRVFLLCLKNTICDILSRYRAHWRQSMLREKETICILTELVLGSVAPTLSLANATITSLFSPAQWTTIWLWESFRLACECETVQRTIKKIIFDLQSMIYKSQINLWGITVSWFSKRFVSLCSLWVILHQSYFIASLLTKMNSCSTLPKACGVDSCKTRQVCVFRTSATYLS